MINLNTVNDRWAHSEVIIPEYVIFKARFTGSPLKSSKNQGITMNTDKKHADGSFDKPDRRQFLKFSTASTAAVIAGSGVALAPFSKASATDYSVLDRDPALRGERRATRAGQIRLNATRKHFNDTLKLPTQHDNNDERRYKSQNFYASFTKTLPANEFGEVDPSSFKRLRKALRTGRQRHFDRILRDSSAVRRLENPQGALRFETSAKDSHASRIAPSFKFRSAQGAGEMTEVYWQALARDVPFIEYDEHPTTRAAVLDLNNLTEIPGAVDGSGQLSAQRLFRGETPGDLVGPYISQFLLRDVSFGSAQIVQRYEAPLTANDYMTDLSNWLNVQRGAAPLETAVFDSTRRYIYNNRSLAEYVHRDILFQAYQFAALQLVKMPGGDEKYDTGNPYFNGTILNQTAFGSLGEPQIQDMVTRVANIALASAWFQKWRVHRFLRPEAYAARVHFKLSGDRPDYEVHDDVLNSNAVDQLMRKFGTALCPQAYIEGSPTHPSFPAGHATVAGACVTVLKAMFNEDFVIENPVQASATGTELLPYQGPELTIGGELNKLANNISLGRDAAGVHYRQDGIQGLVAGQQQAVAYLQDQSRNYNERSFGGFTFKSFEGTLVSIKDGNVTYL